MNPRPAQPLATANVRSASPAAVSSEPSRASASAATLPANVAPRFPAELAAAADRCWAKAAAPSNWELTREEFQAALERSAAKRFAAGASAPSSTVAPRDTKKIEVYLDALHARDLALAIACGKGSGAAWDFFMAEYRPELYRAARAIVGPASDGDAAARDLADSLYAELYGLRESAAGHRKSLFEYFHGRSKLTTWLHAVLSQRNVDEIRRARASEPLENEAGELTADVEASAAVAAGASRAPETHADSTRAGYLVALQAALAATLGALDSRDRLRLACYYADERTLSEIGRMFGEHEATVSRKLERTRREVRARVAEWLRDAKKWSAAQMEECLECAKGEWPFDLTAHLRPPDARDSAHRTSTMGSTAAGRKI
jgi:RNA polymerase sigma-70 factor (ECF subfamily)